MQRWMRQFWLLLGANLLVALTLHATPASLKAAGMGGAATAYPQDSLTTVDNPANAAQICRRIDLGFSWLGTTKELTIANRPNTLLQQGEFDPDDSNQFFCHAGINFWFDPCIAAGIAFHNEADMRTRYDVRLEDFEFANGPNTRFNYSVNTLTFTLAHPFWDYHSVGVSVDIDFARLNVGGLGRLAALSNRPDRVTDRNHSGSAGVGITVGYVGYLFPRCLPGLSVGVAYSPRVWFRHARKYEGLFADHRLGIPAKVRVGIGWDVLPCVSVALDVEFLNWTKLRSWSNRFPGNSTTGIGALFGTRNGPGFGWRDQCIVKTGFDWQICEHWTVRAGYRYESPLWRQYTSTGILNVLTFQTIQHYVTGGITWNYSDCLEFTAFGEYGFPGRRHAFLPSITRPDLEEILFQRGDFYLKAESYRAGLVYGLRF
jgi:long-chain fatty acid transport protein